MFQGLGETGKERKWGLGERKEKKQKRERVAFLKRQKLNVCDEKSGSRNKD